MNALARRVWTHRAFYLMLTLPVLYYVLFKYGPLYGTVIAFKDFHTASGILGSPFADPWYRHFAYFFHSPYFTQLLANTLLISLYKLFFGMPMSILLAVALNEVSRGWYKRTIQTVTYLPHFLSWVIVYGIMYALLSESMGAVNGLIRSLTGRTVPFMTSPAWFRPLLVGSEIWAQTGWGAIIYLAAIAGIDPTLYEAAAIDGATRIGMIRRITLPSIAYVIVILLVLRMGSILEAGFEQIYIFYNVRVYSVGDVIDTWVFRTGLEQWNFSLASAVGLFKSAIGMTLMLLVNPIARRWGYSLW